MDKRVTMLKRQQTQRIRQTKRRRYREKISEERQEHARLSHMLTVLATAVITFSMLLAGLALPSGRASASGMGFEPLPVLTTNRPIAPAYATVPGGPCETSSSYLAAEYTALSEYATRPRHAVPSKYAAQPKHAVPAQYAEPPKQAASSQYMALSEDMLLVEYHAALRRCPVRYRWPVKNPEILRGFDKLEHDWDAGHRGIDLRTDMHDELMAPADGVIAFAGSVAGKSVVTIRHGALTSTFEPAVSSRAVGASVRRGDVFAQVQGESDHCLSVCVHWGLKRGKGKYVDPAAMVQGRKIGLLP